MLIADLQRLATQKIFKKRKNSKANSIFFCAKGRFSAKTAKKGPVFRVSTKLLQGGCSLSC